MLVRRRRAMLGLVGAAAATMLVGLLVAGPDLHRQWLDTRAATGAVARNGNRSLWAAPGAIATTLALAVVAATLFATWRDESAGFIAALFAGLLLAPYTLVYAASILLLAVSPGLEIAPVATRVLALVANPAMVGAFGAWCGAGLATTVAAARGAPGDDRLSGGR
jgi:hypothetical protein